MKSIQRVILLVIAVTIFLTGIGVTVVDFCCSSCSEQTLFMTTKHVCCKEVVTHTSKNCCSQTNNIEQEESDRSTAYTSDMHCTTSRLSIDIDASSSRPHLSNSFIWVSTAQPELLATASQITTNYAVYSYPKTPPGISPREYLSLIKVLII